MANPGRETYLFGPFTLHRQERTLLRDGQLIPLRPKDFEMLLVLVTNSGRVVEKDELMRQVWPNTFVEEANLSHHVFTLRKALGDEKDGSRYIATIPRRGYRFVAPVTAPAGGANPAPASESSAPPTEVSPPSRPPSDPMAPPDTRSRRPARRAVVALAAGAVAAAAAVAFGPGMFRVAPAAP